MLSLSINTQRPLEATKGLDFLFKEVQFAANKQECTSYHSAYNLLVQK